MIKNKNKIRKIAIYIFFSCSVFALSSCLEIVNNGDFDGNWHLMSTEDLSTNTVTDISQRYIFWGVAVRLINIRDIEQQGDYDRGKLGYYFRFSKSDKSLVLTEAYENHWHQDHSEQGGDIPLSDYTKLHHLGIFNIPQTFVIEHISGSKMILKSEIQRMVFQKQ